MARSNGRKKRKVKTLAERAALRKDRRRGWRSQQKSRDGGCWAKHAPTLFLVINIAFMVRCGKLARVLSR